MQSLSDNIFTEWYHRWSCSQKDVYLYYPTCTETKYIEHLILLWITPQRWKKASSFLSMTGKKNHSRNQQSSASRWIIRLHWWLAVYPKCTLYGLQLSSLENQMAKCTCTVEASSGQLPHQLTSVDNVFQYSLANQMFTFWSQHEMLKNRTHQYVTSNLFWGIRNLQLV